MGFEVRTPVFEGPLDVLLRLITKQQVELYEVSIATIVDGFLAHMDQMEKDAEAHGIRLDLELTTEFLLIASTLVELKARRLLPGREDVDLDEELALWEERDILLSRLVEAKTFKDAARALLELEENAKVSYPRTAGMEDHFMKLSPDPLENTSADRLRAAFMKAMAPKEPEPTVDLHHVTNVRMTVVDAIELMAIKLSSEPVKSFAQLTCDLEHKVEVIVHFLAVLELYKQGRVEIDQTKTFGTLNVMWNSQADDESFVVDLAERVLVDAYEG